MSPSRPSSAPGTDDLEGAAADRSTTGSAVDPQPPLGPDALGYRDHVDAPELDATADVQSEERAVAPGISRKPSIGLGIGLGTAMLYLSIIVLIPLAAVVWRSGGGGWDAFWAAITADQAKSALILTVVAAFIVGARQPRDGHAHRLGAGP